MKYIKNRKTRTLPLVLLTNVAINVPANALNTTATEIMMTDVLQ